jgi:hypothetical protein
MSRAEIPIDRKIVAVDRYVPAHIEVRRSAAPGIRRSAPATGRGRAAMDLFEFEVVD